MRRLHARADWPIRLATAPLRSRPDFLIIGAMKAGTTSLYDYLAGHPHIVAARKKETRYFDPSPEPHGAWWYRAQFPTRFAGMVTGEATPSYLLYPHPPARAAAELPLSTRFVAVLRDPVERALSHFRHSRVNGQEPLASFAEAVDAEPARLAGEWEKLAADPRYLSVEYRWHSYVTRGDYLPQLRRWHAHVGRDRLLVVTSEDLADDPAATVGRVVAFLGLERHDRERYPRRNPARDASGMDADTRARLREHFAPRNAALADYLGIDLRWQ